MRTFEIEDIIVQKLGQSGYKAYLGLRIVKILNIEFLGRAGLGI